MNKLIKLSDEHYIVVDDSEINEGDWVIELLNKVIFQLKVDGNNYSDSTFKKIIHSTKPLGVGWQQEVIELSLSEIEEAIQGYSVEKMAEEYVNDESYLPVHREENYRSYINGFKAHQELVKDKLFTAITVELIAAELILKYRLGKIKEAEDVENIINSYLPKTEWDVEFVDGKIKLL